MRFFIALEIPKECRDELETVQKQVSDLIPNLRLTSPNKLHLTIAFIGQKDDSMKEALAKAMIQAVNHISPFEVTPAYIDGFPELHRAKVLWVGVKGDIDKLIIIREKIKDQLVNLNLPIDVRRYVPHIAIGKTTNFKLKAETEGKLQILMEQKFKPITISSIKLFESIPEHGFHSHNTLAEIKLS